MSEAGAVSFVVPAFNGGLVLEEALAAIGRAMRVRDELIVFDDGSTDRTGAIATFAGARVLRNGAAPRGPAYGRNAGAAAAANPYLLFVDADIVIAPDARDRLLEDLLATQAVAAFGSYDDHPRSRRATSLYVNLRHHFVHQCGRRDAGTFWSGIGMIRREEFLAAGGFDDALFRQPSIEDVELGLRLAAAGMRLRLVPEAMGTHCKDWSLWRAWHTDVVRRALPWSRLIARGHTLGNDLNVSTGERLNAVLAIATLALLVIGCFRPLALLGAAAAAIAYLIGNRAFLGFLARRLRPGQLLVALGMHWCYHLYASATYAIVMLATRFERRRHGGAAM